MVRSALGRSSCRNRSRNDGTAMLTRIKTGISVQATSINVLWVVRDGTGLARALNLIITVTRSASTNSVITVMMPRSRAWNEWMSSITGVADCCSVNSHGAGWPSSANAVPLAASAAPITANPSNRRPIWLFDIFMSFALPSKSSPKASRLALSQPRALASLHLCSLALLQSRTLAPLHPCTLARDAATIRALPNGLKTPSQGRQARSLERRNPASQIIILEPSQCSRRGRNGRAGGYCAAVTFSRKIRQKDLPCLLTVLDRHSAG